ncbi:methanogenesis marker 9 domain-containing protein [Methanolapillus ohkumae]|uniref:Dihydroorotate dehydrogenase n=1 Tax=Methanolapillus ohkumae TaxID=3028298 RepID=A0AA96VF71_9EURY|nr:Dihydroorotate dehydrogenase [Methanosarcinaceae archaeon Am2]
MNSSTTGFHIDAGGIPIKNPIALSAMAGITDAGFVQTNAKGAGLVVIGAYNLDETARAAAVEVQKRGREEFIEKLSDLEDDVFQTIDSGIDLIQKESPGTVVAVSVRSKNMEPLLKAAELLKKKNSILELDIHCRQPEFLDAGLGEALLKDTPALLEIIQNIKKTGVVLSVKFRTSTVNPVLAAEFFDAAGADILHADAMIERKGGDSGAVTKIRNTTRKLLIANNSVDDFDSALEYFASGADMISVARAARDDPEFIPYLVQKIGEYQNEVGWYNTPKHICKQGDNRGLAFCCPPVKYCRLSSKIEEIGFSPKEFTMLKQEFAYGTPLEKGEGTCFGSLVWCCKLTKPCFYRDGALEQIGLSGNEYMKLKHTLADRLVDKIEEKKIQR